MKSQNQNASRVHGNLAPRAAHPACISLALAFAVGAVFWRASGFDFVNLDDPAYVTANPQVQGGLTFANFIWALHTAHAGNWHPLTWLSHILDAQCFGPGAMGPHLVNVALHLANTLLLFHVLRLMTGSKWRSGFVAALFGLHPLHVESVAWISERKDVLSGFFFMLTLWAYAHFARASKVKNRAPANPATRNTQHATRYFRLALLFFALGLMSKPMLVTLPFVLLLLDYWPLDRIADCGFRIADSNRREDSLPEQILLMRLVLEKVPFFTLALGSSIITFLAQRHGGAVQPLSVCPLGTRLENAVVSYVRYLGKTIWPVRLATPYSDIQAWPLWIVGACALLLLTISFAAWRAREKFPFLVTGWFWFGIMLIPVIGLVQVGAQSLADRYTYLPLIGVLIMFVWGANEIFARLRLPITIRTTAASLVLILLGARADGQLQYWQNSESLLTHAIAVTENNWIAEYNLAWELERQGRSDEALQHYFLVAQIQPNDVDTLNNLGFLLAKKQDYPDALPYFERALRLKPDFVELHYDIGSAQLHLQKFDEAIGHLEIFLKARPEHVAALNELGVALGTKGELDRAMARFREALRYEPNNADAHYNLGEAFALQGKADEARTELNEALRLRPGWAEPEHELQSLNAPPK
jgi:protein O-mannosyl-transferase